MIVILDGQREQSQESRLQEEGLEIASLAANDPEQGNWHFS